MGLPTASFLPGCRMAGSSRRGTREVSQDGKGIWGHAKVTEIWGLQEEVAKPRGSPICHCKGPASEVWWWKPAVMPPAHTSKVPANPRSSAPKGLLESDPTDLSVSWSRLPGFLMSQPLLGTIFHSHKLPDSTAPFSPGERTTQPTPSTLALIPSPRLISTHQGKPQGSMPPPTPTWGFPSPASPQSPQRGSRSLRARALIS